jgi:hypothetical protein
VQSLSAITLNRTSLPILTRRISDFSLLFELSHSSREPFSRRFAKVNDLLSSYAEHLRNVGVIKRQVVPYLLKVCVRHLE